MGADRSSQPGDGGTTVTSITYAPVKGLGLTRVDEVELEHTGVRGNRRFYVISDEGRMVNGKVAGPLVQIAAAADAEATTLSLRFPDGSLVEGSVELGEEVETSFFGRPVAGRIVEGAFSGALSEYAGRPLQLIRTAEPGAGSDRGPDASVSLVSRASLDLLAQEAGVTDIDGRRFRLLFEIDGVPAHEEDVWIGRRIAFGEAVVRLHAHVGRCLVTSQDPDTGVKDLDTLRILKRYRGDVESEEALPLGVWGSVEQPGRVRVGDAVVPL